MRTNTLAGRQPKTALFAIALAACLVATSGAASPALVDTNVHSVPGAALFAIRNPQADLIDVRNVYGHAIEQGESYFAGFEIVRDSMHGLPIDVDVVIPPSVTCRDAQGASSGQLFVDDSGTRSYTLYPPLYGNVLEEVGMSTAHNAFLEYSGHVLHSSGAGTYGSELVCKLTAQVHWRDALGNNGLDMANMTITSSIPWVPATPLFVGGFVGIDQHGKWNGDARIEATPAMTEINILSSGQATTLRMTASAAFDDRGYDMHDNDYMDILFPATDKQLVVSDKLTYRSDDITLYASEQPVPHCVEANIYDEDEFQDDNVATASICVNVTYRNVGPSSGLPLPQFNATVPQACQDAVTAHIEGSLEVPPARGDNRLLDCLRALDAQTTGGVGTHLLDTASGIIAPTLESAITQAEDELDNVLTQLPAVPGVTVKIGDQSVVGTYVFGP